MFGLGPTELIVILVLALLVFGPKRIPELAGNLGKAIRSFRKVTKDLREQIDIEDEVRRPFEDLRAALRDEPPPYIPPPAPPIYSAPEEPTYGTGPGMAALGPQTVGAPGADAVDEPAVTAAHADAAPVATPAPAPAEPVAAAPAPTTTAPAAPAERTETVR